MASFLPIRLPPPAWALSFALLAAIPLSIAALWEPAWLPAATGAWAAAVVMLPAVRRGRFDLFSPWAPSALAILLGVTVRGVYVACGGADAALLDELYLLGKAPAFFLPAAFLLLGGLALLALGYGGASMAVKETSPARSFRGSRLYGVAGLVFVVSLGSSVAFMFLTRDTAPDLLSAKRTTIPSLDLAGSGYESHGLLRFLASLGFFAHWLVLADALGSSDRHRKTKLAFALALFLSGALLPLYASVRGTVALNALLSLALVWHLRPGLPKWIPLLGVLGVALLIHAMTLLRAERDDASAWHRFGWGTEAAESLILNRNQIDLFKTAHIVEAVPDELPYAWGGTVARWLLSPVPRAWWPDKPVIQPGPEIGSVVYGQRVAGVPPGLVAEGYWNFSWPGALAFCWLTGVGMRALERRFRPGPGEIGPRLLVYLAAVYPVAFHALGNSLGMGLHRLVVDGAVMAALCWMASSPKTSS